MPGRDGTGPYGDGIQPVRIQGRRSGKSAHRRACLCRFDFNTLDECSDLASREALLKSRKKFLEYRLNEITLQLEKLTQSEDKKTFET